MHRLWNKPERVKTINSATASDNYMSTTLVALTCRLRSITRLWTNLDGAMVYILDNKDARLKRSRKPVTLRKKSSEV